MTRRSRLLLRAVVVAIVGFTIGAPTPGRLGSCSTQPGIADAREFCYEKEARICARENALRPDEEASRRCQSAIPTLCDGVSWPVGCAPSESTAQACLDALVDVSRIATPPDLLPECAAVMCSGSGAGMEPEGV